MNAEEIKLLIEGGSYPCDCSSPELVETHISWVILCQAYAFKIKKPVNYEFLDFSTLEKRKAQCEKEVSLNRRLTDDIYLGVVSITRAHDQLRIDTENRDMKAETIDYAVRMRKMDPARRMDLLLKKGKVTNADIYEIVRQLVQFHQVAEVIKTGRFKSQRQRFNDLKTVYQKNHHREAVLSGLIEEATEQSDSFLERNFKLLHQREQEGFTRDGHGDLHSRNIFLMDQPVIFDCIEFNEQFRQTDILDELGFFCMDMDAHDHPELGETFLAYYNKLYEVCHTLEEKKLFIYYKAYRANVRAKVNLLRAQSAETEKERKEPLQNAHKYLYLMSHYLNVIVH